MIATSEVVEAMDFTNDLTQKILNSEILVAYEIAFNNLKNDQEAQGLIKAFTSMKDHYEDVQRFGHYHPDYHEIMTKVRSAKRKMDMHPTVTAFKVAEREYQTFLDDISDVIAKSVSDTVMVPRDGLSISSSGSGCSTGGCSSGGSCGCQAS